MIEKELRFQDKPYRMVYFSPEKNNAIILLIHGLAEHIGRYQEFGQIMSKYNYNVCGIDLYGHGKSPGKRGDMLEEIELYALLDSLYDQIQIDYPERPIILMGHSMGGNIAASYLMHTHRDFKALILSSPWLALVDKPNIFLVGFARLMHKIYPSLQISANIDANKISKIQHEVEAYQNDPLNHTSLTPRLFINRHKASVEIIENADKINIPTLVLQGKADKIIAYQGAEAFAKRNSALIKLSIFEKGYHEMLHDEEREEFCETVLDFLALKVLLRF
ncbi:MAG: lysophospholipase [Chitinophagales bacterium]|jgi:alpha-beta hydrolase superfamily lysophospholipase|nr:lysophospholipase [Chitinophagales bacterium]